MSIIAFLATFITSMSENIDVVFLTSIQFENLQTNELIQAV